jgi:cyclophilin family peptidyl-prolyl cis-trans isomerase
MAMMDRFCGRQAPQRWPATLVGCIVLALPLAAPAQESSSLEPRVRFQTTMGDFVIEVDTVRAPLTSANFLNYVREGFYDKTLIHRVVPNFVVQGGGYNADYSERAVHGPVPNESGNGLSNIRGSVGMARGDSPHSATSQFYVNLNDNAGLNPLPSRWGYAVFGKVVEGMEVIDHVTHVATGQRGPFGADAPLEQILIIHAQVLGESPPAAAAPAPATLAPAEPSPADAGKTVDPAAAPADDDPGQKTEPAGESRP